MPRPRLTQPPALKTRSYQCGAEKLNGYEASALFEAAASGDVASARALLAKDARLVDAPNLPHRCFSSSTASRQLRRLAQHIL
jgi:hypothetical protein